VIVNSNGLYKIVPVDLAPVGAVIQTGSVPEAGGKLGSGLQLVPLKYVAASEMRRILEPIAPRGAIVRADEARRTLTLSGTSQDIAGMMEAISIFDVDVMKGMSFALVPVRTSDPATIADELRTVFASDQEGPMAGMVQFLASYVGLKSARGFATPTMQSRVTMAASSSLLQCSVPSGRLGMTR